jgi:hypothetical protein
MVKPCTVHTRFCNTQALNGQRAEARLHKHKLSLSHTHTHTHTHQKKKKKKHVQPGDGERQLALPTAPRIPARYAACQPAHSMLCTGHAQRMLRTGHALTV